MMEYKKIENDKDDCSTEELLGFENFLEEKLNHEGDELPLETVQELSNYRNLIDYLENDFGEKRRDEMEKEKTLRNAVRIVEMLEAEGGKAYAVGGYARDEAFKRFGYDIESKDIDLEVYGVDMEKIIEVLNNEFKDINLVGQSFQVLKVGDIDISIPRKDSKVGDKHTDFEIIGDPHMSIEEASKRRDFTINALLLDLKTGKIVDPHGGLKDLQEGVIRHVDDDTFGDDPLRVLRAMQFAGRFGFDIDEKTIDIAREMPLESISKERLLEEWSKLLIRSPKPSIGLEAGKKMGIFEKIHPELNSSENSSWNQAKSIIDSAARISREEDLGKENQLLFMISALCRNLNSSDLSSTDRAIKFLDSINAPKAMITRVLPLVRENLISPQSEIKDSDIRRLSRKLYPANIKQLTILSKSCQEEEGLYYNNLLKRADEMDLLEKAPQPIKIASFLMLEEGIVPGPILGMIEDIMFDAQLEGDFSDYDGAVSYYRQNKEEILKKALSDLTKKEEEKISLLKNNFNIQ